MEDKNPSKTTKKHSPAFVGPFAVIGIGLGFLFYALGYKTEVPLAVFFIIIGLGLLIDRIIEFKNFNNP